MVICKDQFGDKKKEQQNGKKNFKVRFKHEDVFNVITNHKYMGYFVMQITFEGSYSDIMDNMVFTVQRKENGKKMHSQQSFKSTMIM